MARQAIDAKGLPTFSGLPKEWPAAVFLEQFESTTKECQFSNAENTARLGKSLKGRAKDTVSALLALPGNVDPVISTLQKRFGRPEFMVQSLIEKAKAMKSFCEGDMIGIIDFTNAVVNLSSTMELIKKRWTSMKSGTEATIGCKIAVCSSASMGRIRQQILWKFGSDPTRFFALAIRQS